MRGFFNAIRKDIAKEEIPFESIISTGHIYCTLKNSDKSPWVREFVGDMTSVRSRWYGPGVGHIKYR